MNVQDYLKAQGAWYEPVSHRPTYNAQTMAETLHISGDQVAKTVLLRADKKYVIAVLPASRQIDIERARSVIDAKRVELATELEFQALFPDCQLGAVPPFGSQYGLSTIVDESLAQGEEIVFEGNRHDEAIRMKVVLIFVQYKRC